MNYADFQIAFWHPFGPHDRESAEEIIARKRSEIENNGWTFWSFQRRNTDEWKRVLSIARGQPVFVFCSEGKGAIDPAREGSNSQPISCRSYCFAPAGNWVPMPDKIKVPHPFRPNKSLASAFIVERIFHPIEEFSSPSVEWLRKSSGWDQSKVPTRGEYLIRRGGINRMRRVRAVLELKSPFLATLSSE